MDAEVTHVRRRRDDVDIELRLLLEAIYLRTTTTSAATRWRRSSGGCAQRMARFGCATLSQLQDRVLHDPAVFPQLLEYLTVQVSEMFRDPPYFRALREQVVPRAAHLPVAQGLGRRLQHRRGGRTRSRSCCARKGLLDAHADLRDRHQPRGARSRREAGVYDARPHRRRSPRTTGASGGKRVAVGLLHRGLRQRGVRQARCASSIVFSDHSLATDSVFAEVQLVSCRNVLIYFDRELQDRALGLFRDALCRSGFLGLGSQGDRCASRAHADAFSEFVARASASTRSETRREPPRPAGARSRRS